MFPLDGHTNVTSGPLTIGKRQVNPWGLTGRTTTPLARIHRLCCYKRMGLARFCGPYHAHISLGSSTFQGNKETPCRGLSDETSSNIMASFVAWLEQLVPQWHIVKNFKVITHTVQHINGMWISNVFDRSLRKGKTIKMDHGAAGIVRFRQIAQLRDSGCIYIITFRCAHHPCNTHSDILA